MKRPICAIAVFATLLAMSLATANADGSKDEGKSSTEDRIAKLEKRVDGIDKHLDAINGTLKQGFAKLEKQQHEAKQAVDKAAVKKPVVDKAVAKKPVVEKAAAAKPKSNGSSNPNTSSRSTESGAVTMACTCTKSTDGNQSATPPANAGRSREAAPGSPPTYYMYVPRSSIRIEAAAPRSEATLFRDAGNPCSTVVDPCAGFTSSVDQSRSAFRLGAPVGPIVTRSEFVSAPAAPISSYVVSSLPWSTVQVRGANSFVTVPSQRRPYVLTPSEAAYWGVTESAPYAGSEPIQTFSRSFYSSSSSR